jgi:peptidoglycan L-alanyl-D-glutamate endopeptidase CwlK
MINSRKIEDLTTDMQKLVSKFVVECAAQGITLLITSTYRDAESQNALYNQGRTPESKAKGEKIVTNAKAGQSFHNFRVAVDVVPLVNGKPDWNNTALWQRVGAIGKACGLEWAGDWKKFKEFPHFQLPGQSLEALQKKGT